MVNIRTGQLAVRFSPGGRSRAGLNNGNTVKWLRDGNNPWVYVRIVDGSAAVNGVEGWVNSNCQLEPYKEIKKQLAQAKGILRTLKNELVKRLSAKRAALTDEECQGLVLAIFKDGLTAELERYVSAHRQQVIVAVENWWDKYRVTLQDIEGERDAARQQLSEFLSGLGYA